MALTNQEKSANRRAELNKLAQALGYDTWRKLETDLKRKFLSGERIDISLKPAQGPLHPA